MTRPATPPPEARRIMGIYRCAARAGEHADMWRDQGHLIRVVPRTVSALGVGETVHVIVSLGRRSR